MKYFLINKLKTEYWHNFHGKKHWAEGLFKAKCFCSNIFVSETHKLSCPVPITWWFTPLSSLPLICLPFSLDSSSFSHSRAFATLLSAMILSDCRKLTSLSSESGKTFSIILFSQFTLAKVFVNQPFICSFVSIPLIWSEPQIFLNDFNSSVKMSHRHHC